MSIDGVSGRTSYIGTSIIGLRNQLNDLTQQLASGKVSTTYAGQGADRGFALSLRAQVSAIDAFADTATNVNTRVSVLNLALQGMSDIGKAVKSAAAASTIVLNNNGQTSGQITAQAAFSNAVSLLNTQSGDRYLFSGRTTDTAATVPADVMLNGTGTQAGLTQLINERRQADQGVGLMGHLTLSSPSATVTSLAEDGSSFGLKLGAISSSLTGATVTQPSGTPPAATIDLGAVNPTDGDKITFNFNLPDGTSEAFSLTATTTNPPPAGSFLIGGNTAATTVNLQAALTSSIQTLSDTSLVAASAISASDNFFNPSATITGNAVNNQVAIPGPGPITGNTSLSGAAGTDSLATSFAAGDTITVNGTAITFVSSGATGNQLNVTDSVQTLLAKIDSVTGTSTPSTVGDGVIALHSDNGASLNVASSNSAAFAALGFGAIATQPPLKLAGNTVSNTATTPAPITGATLLSGAAGTDSLASSFAAGDSITVNGTAITFVSSGATGNQLNVTDSVQALLTKIDSITGSSVPSTVSAGAIALRSNSTANLTITSTNSTALGALGFAAPSS